MKEHIAALVVNNALAEGKLENLTEEELHAIIMEALDLQADRDTDYTTFFQGGRPSVPGRFPVES